MSDESQTAFLRLLAAASTSDALLFMVANLSPEEVRRFGETELAMVVDRLYPYLIKPARLLAREHPDTSDDEFDRSLHEHAVKFVMDYGE